MSDSLRGGLWDPLGGEGAPSIQEPCCSMVSPFKKMDPITEEIAERRKTRTQVIFFVEAFQRHLIKYHREASHESEDL